MVSAQVLICCVFTIPYFLDYWVNQVVHLLLLKSSLVVVTLIVEYIMETFEYLGTDIAYSFG